MLVVAVLGAFTLTHNTVPLGTNSAPPMMIVFVPLIEVTIPPARLFPGWPPLSAYTLQVIEIPALGVAKEIAFRTPPVVTKAWARSMTFPPFTEMFTVPALQVLAFRLVPGAPMPLLVMRRQLPSDGVPIRNRQRRQGTIVSANLGVSCGGVYFLALLFSLSVMRPGGGIRLLDCHRFESSKPTFTSAPRRSAVKSFQYP